MTPRTEQSPLNALERAILDAMTREHPSLVVDADRLHVRSRRYTGVGSYTDFACDDSGEPRTLRLKARITMPGLPNGMGAVLYLCGRQLQCLETFTSGDDYWDGASEGFSVS
ncbi:MAG TPA: hypothetical protein VHC69_03695 [Polyangiaceae bacterium]|nr:hypothetical protein [Polyangiaceae bacterium]